MEFDFYSEKTEALYKFHDIKQKTEEEAEI